MEDRGLKETPLRINRQKTTSLGLLSIFLNELSDPNELVIQGEELQLPVRSRANTIIVYWNNY